VGLFRLLSLFWLTNGIRHIEIFMEEIHLAYVFSRVKGKTALADFSAKAVLGIKLSGGGRVHIG
jgi:hypothetical protein